MSIIKNIFGKNKENENISAKPEFWFKELEQTKKMYCTWYDEANEAICYYRSISPDYYNSNKYDNYGVRYNILYSNVELYKSVLFSNFPKPEIKRRFAKKVDNNPVRQKLYRRVSEIIERAVTWNADVAKVNPKMKDTIKDYLLSGRGISWISYEPTIVKKEQDTEEISNQQINVDYVYWKDFRTSWARNWDETWWIARRHYLTRNDLIKQFGKDIGNKVELTHTHNTYDNTTLCNESLDNNNYSEKKIAEVWEIWDKEDKKVYFISEGYKNKFLKTMDNPLGLSGFYPTPEPLQNIKTTQGNIPITDFRAYRKQAVELSNICERISDLTDTLVYRGFIASKNEDHIEDLSKLGNNQFKGIDISEIDQAGGLRNVFYPEPMDDRIKVIIGLEDKKQKLINEIYEITGIADIMRAVSNPKETAAAQKIKGKFGTYRLQERQQTVQNYVKGIIEIMAEIVSEHFTPKVLQKITNIDLPTFEDKQQLKEVIQSGQLQITEEINDILEEPTWQDVIKVLRSDKLRGYIIDVETTATRFDEDQIDKQEAVDVVANVLQYLGTVLPQAMQVPEIMPLTKDMSMFAIKQFKAGRNLEESLEKSFDNLEKKLVQMSQKPQDSGEQAKAQADMQKAQIKAQSDIQVAKIAAQSNIQEQQLENQLKQQVEGSKMRFQVQKEALDKQQKDKDLALRQQDLERKEEKDLADVDIRQEEVGIKQQEANLKAREIEAETALAAAEAEAKLSGQDIDIDTNIRAG
jgi:hypothetical protein